MKNPFTVLQEEKPWYSEGLRFSCTGCGKCCTGSPGYVWVTLDEIIDIAKLLKLSLDEFSSRYVRKIDGSYSLIEHPTTYDCVFLKDNKCQIYTARPKQCRTYPWWQKNLRSKQDWEKAASFCEGINHKDAPTVSYEEISSSLH